MNTEFDDDVPELCDYHDYHCWLDTGSTHLMQLVSIAGDMETQLLTVTKYSEVISMIETIIEDEVNKINEKGWSALMIVCANYKTGCNNLVLRMLIDAGADMNIKKDDGMTSLMLACRHHNNLENIQTLIDAGADLNIKRDSGETALMINCRYLHITETVKMLINAGADVNIKDRCGDTALYYGSYSNNVEIVQMLIDAGADVNIKYSNNKTFLMLLLERTIPLTYVEIFQHDKSHENDPAEYDKLIIQLLHKSRETLLDVDINGKTAYDYYIERGYNILNDYHLKILKGDIHLNNTKSAR